MFRTFSVLLLHKSPRFWALVLCFLFGAFAVAQDVKFNRSAMEGRFAGAPSTVAIRSARTRVARSRTVHHKKLIARNTERRRTRSSAHVRLASLKGRDYSEKVYVAQGSAGASVSQPPVVKPNKGGTGATGTQPPKGGGKKPPPIVPIKPPARLVVLEIPRQNLSFKLVDPSGQPVKGLQMVAHLQTPSQEEDTPLRFASNDAGVCQLNDLPLPASIDFDIARPDGSLPPDTTDENNDKDDDEESEWRFAKPETASLLLERPEGVGRVARIHYTTAQSGVCGPVCPSLATRIKTFQTTKSPIVLERTVVDLQIAAPADSRISSPVLGDEAQTVPADGVLSVRLRRSQMEDGPIPIRVARTLAGGECEAVIDSYPTDPYSTNRVEAPPLELISLSNLDPELHLSVFDTHVEAARVVGDLTGKDNRKNQLGTVTPSDDGAQWWISTAKGIGLKMRPVPGSKPKDKTPDLICERIRVFNAAGGTFGGVGVNSTWAEARAALGEPQVDNAPRLPSDSLSTAGTMASYLDGGLRICHNDEKVLWLEVARPDSFLRGGTTAFVPRSQAKLYVASFSGNPKTNLRTRGDLEGFLSQIGSVQLVASRDEADLVLDAAVVDFKEDRDDFLPLIPIRYDCSLRLQYSLYDTHANRYVVEHKEVVGTAKANFTKEAAIIGLGAGLLYKQAKGLLSALIAGFGIADLNNAARKAANRAPAVCAKSAFNQMVGDINDASDFSVQVTSIDYNANRLTVNAGTNDGVRVGDASHPFDFQLQIAGGQLPSEDEPKTAEYYAARVVQVGPTSSVCELRHIQRSITKTKEKVQDEPAPDVLRQIPDPATGLIGGRAGVQFPDVEIVTEAQVQAATRQVEDAQKNADNQQEAPEENQGKNKLGNILGGIFGKKR
ncbi:hypothetical protein IAD21_00501 [Abditibacteriota bacterium]|nr:hypothetical protein IAD21_00501 [Abditibacteriota bacterium]